MKHTILKKEKTDYGVKLEINYGSTNALLYFENEAELDAFGYMLRLMLSMKAESVSIDCPGEEIKEENLE